MTDPLVFNLLVGMMVISGTSMVILGLYGSRFIGRVPAAVPYVILMFCIAAWAFLYALDIISTSLPEKIFLHNLRFIVVPFIPVLELWLIVAYLKKKEWLRLDWGAILSAIPVLAVVLAITSPSHSLFRYNFTINTSGPVPVLQYSESTFYLVYNIYNLLILVLAIVILVTESRKQGKTRNMQTLLLLFALAIPMAINYLSQVGLTPVPGINMTTSFLWVSAILYTVAIFRYRFLDIIPVARGRVIENLRSPVMVFDNEGCLIDVNPAAAAFLMAKPKDLNGKYINTIFTGFPALIDFVTSAAVQDDGLEIGTGAGRRIFEAGKHTLTSDSGDPLGIIVLLQDITERKAMETTLHENKERLELTIDATNDGIWDWDIPSGKAVFSPRWYTMLGYGPGEMPGNYATFQALVHPDDITRVDRTINEHINLHSSGYAVEMRMHTKTGEWKWVLTRGKVVERDFEGHPVRMVGTHTDITGMKRAEEKISHLASFPELAPVLILETDRSERTIYMNPALQRYLDSTGMNGPEEFFNDEIRSKMQAWDTKTSVKLELEHHIRGRYFIERFFFTPEFKSVRLYASDVTERKQSQEELSEIKDYLESLIHYANAPIIVWNPDFRITEFNHAFERLTGRTEKEVIGQDLEILFPEESKTGSLEFIKKTLAGERMDVVEIPILHVSGETRTVIWNSANIKSPEGTVIATIAQGQDITSRKQAEESLRESEEKFSQAFHSSPYAITITSLPDSIILDVNDGFQQITGYQPDEVRGKTTVELDLWVNGADRQSVISDLQEKISVAGREFMFRVKSGRIITGLFSAKIIMFRNRPYILSSINDITDRKLAEQQRESLIKELELKNAELERFTYTVSHDLKSPLITIGGYLGFLEKDAVSGDIPLIRDDIQRITSATNQMHMLLSDLLSLSRVGLVVNPPERVSMGVIAREAEELVFGVGAERGLTVIIAPDLPLVYADHTRIREALVNLIENAKKFMGDQKNPKIEIGAVVNAGSPVFFVRDNGIGIEPKYHEKIFMLFEKLDVKTEGTGIGLAIVKRIIEVYGGTIWVESDGRGNGTTFWFTLPGRGILE